MKYKIGITKSQDSRLSQVNFDDIPFGRVFSDHMFVADYREGEWTDLRVVPFAPFEIHPAAMGLHYGQSIFEGMKASKSEAGQPLFFRPEMHARRFNNSARRLCMPELPEDLFLEALNLLVAIDQDWIPPQKGSALYIRPLMFATDQFIGVKPSETYKFIIFTGPVGPYYPKPVSLRAETTFVRAVKGGTGEAKAGGNYGGALLPTKLANQAGFDQVMWLDGHDFKYIQEVGTMNIFFVIDGKVVTPETDGAILHGVTRDSIITVLREKGHEVAVRPLTIDEVVTAHREGKLQEVFGSGTAAVVAHVSKIAYGDLVMELPPVEEREVSTFAKAYIDDLRAGLAKDIHNWIVPVEMPATVDA